MRDALKNWHRYVLWAMVSLFFWAWIFTWITDAPPGRKVVFYADCPAMEREALSEALEEDVPEGIRFVEARIFSDEMFSPANLSGGDLFIVSSAQTEKYRALCTPIPEDAFAGQPLYAWEGQVYGVCVYDEALGVAVGTRYVAYIPGEKYYLFFNAESKHLGPLNGSADDAAFLAARRFLALP